MGQRLRGYLSNKVLQIALVALASGSAFWAGHKMDVAIERRSIVQQLNTDGRQLLSRLELVIDQTSRELTKLDRAGLASCGVKALTAARKTILSRGTIKDVEVRSENGNLNCSSTVALTDLVSTPGMSHAIELPDNKSEVFIGIEANKSDGLLRLRKVTEDSTSLNIFVGLDSLLYSFFDPGIRDMASVGIYFNQTNAVVTYGEIQSIRKAAGGFDSDLRSTRYPLSVRLSVPEKSLVQMSETENSINDWLMAIAAFLIALLSSIFGIASLIRPPNPVKELALAIERDEIVPFYQPIIKLEDESISGCEVLVRWIKPDGTLVRPDLFIPLAESSGLIADMTMRTLRRAVVELAPILQAQKSFKIAVNISPDHFGIDGFLSSILKLLKDENVDPSHIVLELTERQQLQDLEAFKAIIDSVRAAGLRISIDDVGTGHNGLSTIQDVPANIIKIDKKFVDTITTNELSAAIVAMLVGLSKQFSRTIVAEGIETRDQLEALRVQGVDEGQGYLFSPALNALKFLAFYGTFQGHAAENTSSVSGKLAA